MMLTETPRAHFNRVCKVKALPHQLDNEEVNAAEATAVMRLRGARAGSSMGRRWGHAEQSSSEECASGSRPVSG